MVFVSDRFENTVGKEENAVDQHIFPLKFLDMTKLKAFADHKLNVAKITIFLFDRAENTVGQGENAGYQHFLLFLQCFPKSP